MECYAKNYRSSQNEEMVRFWEVSSLDGIACNAKAKKAKKMQFFKVKEEVGQKWRVPT